MIELDKITEKYGNARILFSLNLLTQDSPTINKNLTNVILLSRDLDECVRNFIFKEKNYNLDIESEILYLSGFFKRYSKFFDTASAKNFIHKINNSENLNDFEKNIIIFLLDYVREADKQFLLNNKYVIVFNKDDYLLNFIK
jgi:hypothetical protein